MQPFWQTNANNASLPTKRRRTARSRRPDGVFTSSGPSNQATAMHIDGLQSEFAAAERRGSPGGSTGGLSRGRGQGASPGLEGLQVRVGSGLAPALNSLPSEQATETPAWLSTAAPMPTFGAPLVEPGSGVADAAAGLGGPVVAQGFAPGTDMKSTIAAMRSMAAASHGGHTAGSNSVKIQGLGGLWGGSVPAAQPASDKRGATPPAPGAAAGAELPVQPVQCEEHLSSSQGVSEGSQGMDAAGPNRHGAKSAVDKVDAALQAPLPAAGPVRQPRMGNRKATGGLPLQMPALLVGRAAMQLQDGLERSNSEDGDTGEEAASKRHKGELDGVTSHSTALEPNAAAAQANPGLPAGLLPLLPTSDLHRSPPLAQPQLQADGSGAVGELAGAWPSAVGLGDPAAGDRPLQLAQQDSTVPQDSRSTLSGRAQPHLGLLMGDLAAGAEAAAGVHPARAGSGPSSGLPPFQTEPGEGWPVQEWALC